MVVILSDGWDRGNPAELGEHVARLSRVAHRLVWVNPHVGKAGYAPVQGGIVAALPHLDDLRPGPADILELSGAASAAPRRSG